MSRDTNPLLDAASSATGAATNLIETVRCRWEDHASEIDAHEVIPHLVHAFYQVGTIKLASTTSEEAEMLGQLMAAASRYLDGWTP